MNAVDLLLIVCFVPALVLGLQKGFVRQAMGLVALVVGIWFSWNFSEPLSIWLLKYFDISPTYMDVIAFIIVLALVIFLLSLLGNLFERVLKLAMLGWLDKLLGMPFALLKMLLVLGLVIICVDAINSTLSLIPSETLDDSVLYHPIKSAAYVVFPYLKELIFHK